MLHSLKGPYHTTTVVGCFDEAIWTYFRLCCFEECTFNRLNNARAWEDVSRLLLFLLSYLVFVTQCQHVFYWHSNDFRCNFARVLVKWNLSTFYELHAIERVEGTGRVKWIWVWVFERVFICNHLAERHELRKWLHIVCWVEALLIGQIRKYYFFIIYLKCHRS